MAVEVISEMMYLANSNLLRKSIYNQGANLRAVTGCWNIDMDLM